MAPVLTRLSSGGGFGFDKKTAAAAAATAATVTRSLRFNSADSAYLSRTPASAGNRKTWTWAGWVKRATLNQNQLIFSAGPRSSSGNATGLVYLQFEGDVLAFTMWTGSGSNVGLKTTAVFRDPSAWYHIVAVLDTDNATSSERSRLYVNGVRITAFAAASYPAQGAQFSLNNTEIHEIGRYVWAQDLYLSSYLADVHLINGQALTPSSFTETDVNGILQPKAYSGSYGTTGFHLDFADNSAATAAALGKDTSGNGNNWTPNNLSVTAGAGNDSLRDSPSSPAGQTDSGAGGTVVGNYCTWNPLNIAGGVLSNGNLDLTNTAGGRKVGTFAVSSGKWYWEINITSAGDAMIGIMPPSNPASTAPAQLNYLAGAANEYGYYGTNGHKYNNGSSTAYGATFTNGNVIGVALDMDAGTLVFYKNGSSQGTAFTGLTGTFAPGASAGGSSGASMTANFGQRAFAYTAPSGFKALCTANLPEGSVTTSGTFTGNASADGPFIYLNGVPTAMTINGNAVTFGTQADKLSNGFKLRTSSASYNTSGSNTYSITTTGDKFKNARAQSNP